MKYAIVESGGKQYKAVEGSFIQVDRMSVEEGEQVVLDNVLLVSEDGQINVGAPSVEGAKVKTTVLGEFKGPKIVVFKYQAKKRIRVKTGHRQKYTRLAIDSGKLAIVSI